MDRHEEFLKQFLTHQADLRAFIGSLVLDRHAREDVLQEVALILWRQIEQFDPNRRFGAWARGIAANKILQRRQQDARFPLAFPPETIQAVLDAYDRTEEANSARGDALQACLEELPDKSRRLLAMRYERELKPEAIAQELRGTVDAVYQALSRLRARLEECIRRKLGLVTG
jgi:RNA polymerase sigma-70 factor (ECF subfamily)